MGSLHYRYAVKEHSVPTNYVPRVANSDLSNFLAMLNKASYSADEELEVGPSQLGHKEYQCYSIGMKVLVVLPEGFGGDTDCYTNFYFSLQEETFLEHGSCIDDPT